MAEAYEQEVVNFFGNELDRALREQSFGITTYSITSANDVEAIATVKLLNGTSVDIKLTIAGYEPTGTRGATVPQKKYEVLEDLLTSISPEYENRRTAVLMSKLEELAGAAEQV